MPDNDRLARLYMPGEEKREGTRDSEEGAHRPERRASVIERNCLREGGGLHI